ncbi:MAG: 30S ribosomal protein S3 [Balneolaceae bacterium]|nr:30S ribosomal protein S3 [Balneolaceae bacterium]MBO6546107.1 30S ribosomal protein S3 [Balneolaceae bacterium]MBO6647503.1 30S ribosomal protein S3 [Balneolaceae bacterium]
MGQKTNPVGFRLGIIRGWDSNWYSEDNQPALVLEDTKLREYLQTRLRNGGLSNVVIERTPKRILLTLRTSRPGVIIGKGGEQIELLREELKKVTNKEVQINVSEIKRPELDASLVAQNIAQQLQARVSFRRAMKTSIASAMRMGAKGIKVRCAGRLGGAEMARTEQYKEGQIPLHTLRADIDYATSTSNTIYGSIGVSVWIFKGEIIGDVDLTPGAKAQQEADQSRGRRGGDKNDRRNNRRRNNRNRNRANKN